MGHCTLLRRSDRNTVTTLQNATLEVITNEDHEETRVKS